MRLIIIDFRNIKTRKRYVLLSSDNESALYKRYFSIFYIRVSKIYKGSEMWTYAIKKFNSLTEEK